MNRRPRLFPFAGRAPAAALFTVALLGLALRPVEALWQDFLPRSFENGAYLDAYTSFERDHMTTNGRTQWWDDLFFREKITLFSRGYSYHPRFLQYRFSIAGAARHEDYSASSYQRGGWDFSPGLEYDATVNLLPEHAYHLETFARRYEPLYKERAATQHSAVQSRQGVNARYEAKPWFAHAGYLHDLVETGVTSTDINRVNLDGQWFQRSEGGNELSFTGAFNPMWFSTSEGLDGTTTYGTAGNFLNLQDVPRWAVPLRISSNVSKTLYEQEGLSPGRQKNDQFLWYEWATATLPWNFRSDAYFRWQDNRLEAPAYTRDYTNRDLKVDLTHRLYLSLDSIYTYRNSAQDSSGGASRFHSNGLVFNYSKIIPWGRVLVGTNLSRGETQNSGLVEVTDEPFTAEVPMLQPYVLGQANVDPTQVYVFYKDPLPPYGLKFLEPEYFSVVPVGNTYGVQVTGMPAVYALPLTVEFLVSYNYTGEFRLRTDTIGTTVSVQLFDSLVTPYFTWLNLSSDLLEGEFPGVPVDSTTYTGGVILRYAGAQLRGEYQDYNWQVAPYTAWRADLQYVRALGDDTNLFAAASYLNRDYTRGSALYYAIPYTEETETASASLQHHFFDRSLFASLGGGYTHTTGIVDSDTSTLNSSVLWKVGKVDLTVGANAFLTDSVSSNKYTMKRDHQFLWMNLRRRLF